MIGFGKRENIIYLIDYGLSKKKQEINYTQFGAGNLGKKKLAGTPIYASINAHLATGGITDYEFLICECRVQQKRRLGISNVRFDLIG